MLQALNNLAFFIGAFVALALSFVGFLLILNIRMFQLKHAQDKHWFDFVGNLRNYIHNIIDERFREIERDIEKDL